MKKTNNDGMELISLNAFKKLKPGAKINVLCNDVYKRALVLSEPFLSVNLENIIGDQVDWEVETDIGFVHNDSVYVRKK